MTIFPLQKIKYILHMRLNISRFKFHRNSPFTSQILNNKELRVNITKPLNSTCHPSHNNKTPHLMSPYFLSFFMPFGLSLYFLFNFSCVFIFSLKSTRKVNQILNILKIIKCFNYIQFN